MIEARRLTKAYGRQVALDGVSLRVERGTVVALLGPNGSGKTTLLRVLATLTRPSAGTGAVGGCDLVVQRDAVRSLIGFVGHGTQLYDDLTAAENVAFAAALAGLRPAGREIGEILARVGLEAQAGARARALSTGMRRRLALARVLLRRPPVLLLDEPFAGLDHESAQRLEADLLTFRADGGTALLSTHSPARALTVADRAAILADGRLAADEPCDALTEDRLQRLCLGAVEVGA